MPCYNRYPCGKPGTEQDIPENSVPLPMQVNSITQLESDVPIPELDSTLNGCPLEVNCSGYLPVTPDLKTISVISLASLTFISPITCMDSFV